MAIFFEQAGIAVLTSPKVLSTSLKLAAFQMENGRPFETFRVNGKVRNIHHVYTAGDLSLDSRRPELVVGFFRDPVDRFLSMYRNRVQRLNLRFPPRSLLGMRELVQPSPDELARNLERYRRLSAEVRHHSQPQVTFLGRAKDFDLVFDFEDVSSFESLMSSRLGSQFKLPKSQTSGRVGATRLDVASISSLEKFYEDDFKFLRESVQSGTYSVPNCL